jgi:hypothetical protein
LYCTNDLHQCALADSHTHDEQTGIVDYRWTNASSGLTLVEGLSAQRPRVRVPLGQHSITLTITDNAPVPRLDVATASFSVVAAHLVPGCFVEFYTGQGSSWLSTLGQYLDRMSVH